MTARLTRRFLLAGASLAVFATPAAAQDAPVAASAAPAAHAAAFPYIELSQTADVDLKSGDVLTYTSVAAGIDASISTARTQAQVSARYEHRFGETHHDPDEDVYSGLARGSVMLAPGLSLEGGVLATRVRDDIRGAAPGVLAGDRSNISQLWSVYAGPTLATHAGLVSIDAGYRIGYTEISGNGGGFGVAPGQPRLDYLDHSLGQAATAAVGVAPHTVLPVGLTLSGGWAEEHAGQLSQHYDDYYGRGDVLAPVSPHVALAAGVGYERVETSEKAALLNADGTPVIDSAGRYVTDQTSARRITYRTDGVYYDAGIIWKPNKRTSVAGYVGRRYGTMSYTGSIAYQASRTVGFGLQAYDQVTTFGRQLRTGLGQLPTSFIATRDQFAQAFNGCTYGTSGAAPGGCLNGIFQSVTNATYRARGVDAALSATRGLNTFGVGAGYQNRKLYEPDLLGGATIYGNEDESAYGDLFWDRRLSPVSGLDVNAFVDYYDPALATASDVTSVGGTASYYHNWGRLSATASLGVYYFHVGDGVERSSVHGEALLGARYTFGGAR